MIVVIPWLLLEACKKYRSWICSVDRAVLVSSVVSCSILVLMMSQASVTGTLVKRHSTSKADQEVCWADVNVVDFLDEVSGVAGEVETQP